MLGVVTGLLWVSAIAAVVTAGVEGYSAYRQSEAQEKDLDLRAKNATEQFQIQRAQQHTQRTATMQGMATAYSQHVIKLNQTERELSDPEAFTRHNAPHRPVSNRHTVTEREQRVRAAFDDALPSRGYGKPTVRT